MDKPLISIITVVYNGEKHLEDTIESVINQTYQNIEYIIIDGGSTDGTIDIIKKYEDRISYWISEEDSGIYDAMNKGIKLVSGDWINFMNSGDIFADDNIIKSIFNDVNYDSETILYGDVGYIYKDFIKNISAGKIEKLWRGMQFSHQSTFFKTKYHKNHLYNTQYKIAADFDIIYTAYKNNKEILNLNRIVSNVSLEGLSDSNRNTVIEEYESIVNKFTIKNKYKLYYLYFKFSNLGKYYIKLILPDYIKYQIKRFK